MLTETVITMIQKGKIMIRDISQKLTIVIHCKTVNVTRL